MNTFRYLPYYQHGGSPLREKLSEEDQKRNIRLFYEDVTLEFEDAGYSVSVDSDGVISIHTQLTSTECNFFVERILHSLELYARQIKD